jgi:hypothetical protein
MDTIQMHCKVAKLRTRERKGNTKQFPSEPMVTYYNTGYSVVDLHKYSPQILS